MPERSYTIDQSRFPLVVVRLRGALSFEDFTRYLRDIEEVLRRGKQAHILDFRDAQVPSREILRAKAEWFRREQRLMEDQVAGTALVFHSPMFRFMLTSILLMVRVPVPFASYATMEAAEAWAHGQLRTRFGLGDGDRAA